MKIKLTILLTGLLLAAIPCLSGTHYVVLQWTPSPSTNVIGYKVYWGWQTTLYTNFMDVGNVTNAAISNLDSSTYFFAATAYASNNIESDYSTEAFAVIGTNRAFPAPSALRLITP